MAESNAFSDAAENEVLNVLFRNQARTFAAAVPYVALVTANVTESQTGATITEVANANGYARLQLTFGSVASGGAISNTAALTFTASGGNWGTIVGIAIVDVVTFGSGNILMFDNSMTDTVINNGDSITFAIGAITCTVT